MKPLIAILALAPAGAYAQAPDAPAAPTQSVTKFAVIPGPSVDAAMRALFAAHAHAAKAGRTMSCTVVDVRGDLIAAARMDGARAQTAELALGKARMAAFFGRPSGSMTEMANSAIFPSLNASLEHRLFPAQGAVPILRDGSVIGAIGCSGGSGQQDEDAARAGLDRFASSS